MSRYIYPSGYSPDPLDPGVGALAAWDDDALTYRDLLAGHRQALHRGRTDVRPVVTPHL